jgi:hypothetical protein
MVLQEMCAMSSHGRGSCLVGYEVTRDRVPIKCEALWVDPSTAKQKRYQFLRSPPEWEQIQ